MLVMVVITAAQVFARYVMKAPLAWSSELDLYILLWLVFLGSSIVYKKKAHLSIEGLMLRMKGPLRRAMLLLANLTSAGFFLLLAVYGAQATSEAAVAHSPVTGISSAVGYAAVPLSAFLMLLHLIAHVAVGGKAEGR